MCSGLLGMKEDQPVRSGHRAILQRFNIAIGKYGDFIFSLNCLALIIIFIKSSLKRLMVTVISGRWPRIEGTIAPRFRIFFQLFSDTFLNSDMRLQWLWLHLTGNLFDNIMTWGSSFCIFLAPSWMCGSSSTASLVLCSQELRNVIGSYLAQSSGGDVKECSLLRTKKGSCRQSLSTGRAQSRGGRLLPRWGGDVLNRDGQGYTWWPVLDIIQMLII